MSKPEKISYAQARLFLGIANVGFWVCLAAGALYFGLVGRYFPTTPITGQALGTSLAIFLLGYVALQAPFDWVGGYFLPQSYWRCYWDFSGFVTNWVRGVVGQLLLFVPIALSWLFFSHWLVGLVLGWMLFLLAIQAPLARVIGNFQSRGLHAWKSLDDAFTGGIVGFPGFQSPIFVTGRGQRARAMDERRREGLQDMRLPEAGLVIAGTFNLVGLLLASRLAHYPVATMAGLVEMALWFTLWSFVGLLVLPSVSRPAVYAGDYALYARGISREDIAPCIETDPSQAGETQRGNWVERIFIPCPVRPIAWPAGDRNRAGRAVGMRLGIPFTFRGPAFRCSTARCIAILASQTCGCSCRATECARYRFRETLLPISRDLGSTLGSVSAFLNESWRLFVTA
jgi:hypothetical protein